MQEGTEIYMCNKQIFSFLDLPWIFKLNYFPFFGLYGQAETTGVITETSTKIPRGTFLKFLIKNLHEVLI